MRPWAHAGEVGSKFNESVYLTHIHIHIIMNDLQVTKLENVKQSYHQSAEEVNATLPPDCTLIINEYLNHL